MDKLFQFFEKFLLCAENGIIQRNHAYHTLLSAPIKESIAGNID